MAAFRRPIALLAGLALTLLTLPAAAEPMSRPDGSGTSPLALRLEALIDRIDDVDLGDGWLAMYLSRMGVSDRYGLTYTQYFDAGAKGMRLRVGGPALRRLDRFGLSLELRF